MLASNGLATPPCGVPRVFPFPKAQNHTNGTCNEQPKQEIQTRGMGPTAILRCSSPALTMARWAISGSGQPSAARTYAAWRPFAARVPSSPASNSASLTRAISASVIFTSGGRTTARGSFPRSTSASFMRLCISMNGSA